MADGLQQLIMSRLNLFDPEPTIEHIWLSKRLKSLDKWPMVKPSASDMAEAGFYCPNPDVPETVRCFSCFIELDGWEPTDNPWEEHKKRALTLKPPCKFVEIGKKESDIVVDDFLEILKSIVLRVVNDQREKSLAVALYNHKKKKSILKKEVQKMGLS